MSGDGGELVGHGVEDPVVLGVDRRRVGLVIHGVQQGCHPAQLLFGQAATRFAA